MSDADQSGLWSRQLTRRTVLHTGGIGVAASALGALGGFPSAARANGDKVDLDAPSSRTSMSHEELTPNERVSRAIESLDEIVSDALERTGAPGLAVSVAREDDVPYARGFGVRSSRGSEPVDEDTVFQIASISKPVASTVVAGLVGDGLVDWDSRITELMPEFEMHEPWVSREVTIRDMFSHRSGLPDHAGDLLEDIGFNRDEVLHRLRFQRPGYSLRAGYAYTNFGFTAAGEAAARTAGLSWEELSKQRLYDRLGMSRTSSRFSDFLAHSNRAEGHVNVDGNWRTEYVRDPDPQSPAGGVSSSVRDMARWMQLHLGNGTVDDEMIISGAALAETHRPQVIREPAADPATDMAGLYGLGWNVGYDHAGRVRLSHSGAFGLGSSTSVFLVPAWDVGICVLTHIAPIGLAEAIVAGFVDLIDAGEIQNDYIELFGPLFAEMMTPPYRTDYDDSPANPTASLDDAAYTGVYDNELYGPIEITTGSNGLVLNLGPEPTPYELTHYDRDVFLYEPQGENAYGASSVSFAMQPDGTASSVVIDILNQDGQGAFNRVVSSE